jgi:preprotein translocase subunit SecA
MPLPPGRRQAAASPAKGEAPRREPVTKKEKVGRNDPCPCGSGKKYKKCCGRNE